MNPIPFPAIQPLIATAQADGPMMQVTFRCPVSGTTVSSTATIQADDGLGSRAAEGAKRSLLWGVKNALSRAVQSALGHGMLGSAASSAAYGAMSDVGSKRSYSEEEKRAAIVAAFERVKDRFIWDAAGRRFISAQAGGEVLIDFMRQLETAPIATPYDRRVTARMLASIAAADGSLGDEERQFLAGFMSPELGSVDDLVRMPQPSAAELAECAPGPSRHTMLMLAWAVAFTDEELAPQEARRLSEFAAGLAVDDARAGELRRFAQIYVVDQALGRAYPDGRRDPAAHADVMALARRIGLEDEQAERVDIRFRKRYGLL
jgi:hypothetical protein